MTTEKTLEYYAAPGPLTTAGPGATALAALPSTVPDLLAAVQGLLVHEPGSAESATSHLRTTHQILDRILTADPRRSASRHTSTTSSGKRMNQSSQSPDQNPHTSGHSNRQ